MYKAIMVPLDGSEFSEQAVPVANEIARRAGATLHLVHVHTPYHPIYVEGMPVVDDEMRPLHEEHEEAYLERLRAFLMADDALEVRCTLLDGAPAYALADYAAENGIELIIMTAHGRKGLERAWLGSVADTLVRCSPVPLFLLRGEEDDPEQVAPVSFHHFLIPLDGSALSEEILEPALALGEAMQATYHLLYVLKPAMTPAAFLGAEPDPTLAGLAEERFHAARHYLEGIAERLEERGVSVTTAVRLDDQPAVAILEEAQAEGFGVIAMATRGYSGLRRLLLGSVADKVVRSADRPILLYPPQATGEEESVSAVPKDKVGTPM